MKIFWAKRERLQDCDVNPGRRQNRNRLRGAGYRLGRFLSTPLNMPGKRVQFGIPIAPPAGPTPLRSPKHGYQDPLRQIFWSTARLLELKEAHEPWWNPQPRSSTRPTSVWKWSTTLADLWRHRISERYGGETGVQRREDAPSTREPTRIQRVVIASHIIGKAPKTNAPAAQAKGPITGHRKKMIFCQGNGSGEGRFPWSRLLKSDGFDFTVGIDLDDRRSPSGQSGQRGQRHRQQGKCEADRGSCLSGRRRYRLLEDRLPETLKYVPLDEYVGMSEVRNSRAICISPAAFPAPASI